MKTLAAATVEEAVALGQLLGRLDGLFNPPRPATLADLEPVREARDRYDRAAAALRDLVARGAFGSSASGDTR